MSERAQSRGHRRLAAMATAAERRLAARDYAVPLRRLPARPERTPVGRWLARHRRVRRVAILLSGLGIAATALLAFPGTASALPLGGGGCTTPPAPESPGGGISGFFTATPNPPPKPEDPFAAGAKTTPFEQYGLAGLSWYTYDLGCGGAVRDPSGSITTWAARTLFIPAKAGVSALAAVSSAALDPTYLTAFDPLLTSLTSTLRKAVFTPLAPLAVMLTGLLLLAQATRARVSASTTAIGWCVLVTALAAALFAWPVRAGHAADTVITTGVGTVSRGITGDQGKPGDAVANLLYKPFMFRMWLMGEFCDPNSVGAAKHGADLLQAQAVSWGEAALARGGDAEKLATLKQARFDQVAAQVKKDDPTAYQCLAGHGTASLEASLLADVGVLLMAPFLLIGGLILIAAYLIIRFAIIFAPALFTAGAFFPLRGVVVAAARVVAAAIINGILFTLCVLLVIRVDSAILDPGTHLPAWLRLVLVGVVTVVMWYLTRPFRKLTTMVTTARMAWAMGDHSYDEQRGVFSWRRRQPLVVERSDQDGMIAAVANPRMREESRGPVGVGFVGRLRPARIGPASAAIAAGGLGALGGLDGSGGAAGMAGAAGRAGGPSPLPLVVGATRLDEPPDGGDRRGADPSGRPGLPPGIAAAEVRIAPSRPRGLLGALRTAADGGAQISPEAGGPPAARAGVTGTAGAARAIAGAPAAIGSAAAPEAGVLPVHQPPVRVRRPAERVAGAAPYPQDSGLYDAAAAPRPAPEDDNRGYLLPVEPGLDADELIRLFDPSRDRSAAGTRAWSR